MVEVMTAFKLRSQKVVAKMAASFLSEGYTLTLKMESVTLMFYKFHHLKNGNSIVVKGFPLGNSFVILKNGQVVKTGQIIKNGCC